MIRFIILSGFSVNLNRSREIYYSFDSCVFDTYLEFGSSSTMYKIGTLTNLPSVGAVWDNNSTFSVHIMCGSYYFKASFIWNRYSHISDVLDTYV